jgi:hypothetical protein
MGRHLEEAGVSSDLIIYQGGAAATPRSIELAHLALGVSSDDTKRTLEFLEHQAARYNEEARVRREKAGPPEVNPSHSTSSATAKLDAIFGPPSASGRRNHLLVDLELMATAEEIRDVVQSGGDLISLYTESYSPALALTLARVAAVGRQLERPVPVQLEIPATPAGIEAASKQLKGLTHILVGEAESADELARAHEALRAAGFEGAIAVSIDNPILLDELDRIARFADYMVVQRRSLGERVGWANLPVAEERIHRACRSAKIPSVFTLDEERIAQPASPSTIHSIYEAMVTDGARAVLMSFPAEERAAQVRSLDIALHDMDTARFREAVLGKLS